MNVTVDSIYLDSITVLSDIKLTSGPLAVSATLKKRPDLAKFILGRQVNYLDDIVDKIKALTVSEECDNLDSESK